MSKEYFLKDCGFCFMDKPIKEQRYYKYICCMNAKWDICHLYIIACTVENDTYVSQINKEIFVFASELVPWTLWCQSLSFQTFASIASSRIHQPRWGVKNFVYFGAEKLHGVLVSGTGFVPLGELFFFFFLEGVIVPRAVE